MSSIIGGIFGKLAEHFNNSEEKKAYFKSLIKYSPRCQDLIYEYNSSINIRRPIMGGNELQKALIKTVSDPQEEKTALAALRNAECIEIEAQQGLRNNRKVGYKYEEDIFRMFGTRSELEYTDVYEYIKNMLQSKGLHYSTNSERKKLEYEIEEVLNIWKSNHLIFCPNKQTGTFRISFILTSKKYSLDEDDLTYERWLKKQKKS